MGQSVVLLSLPLLAIGCIGSDDRAYGGGALYLDLTLEAEDPVEMSWVIPGLTGQALADRGRSWSSERPDCDPGPGAWLFIDNYVPFELRACGEGLSLLLNTGPRPHLGEDQLARNTDLLLWMSVQGTEGQTWSLGPVSAEARISLTGDGTQGAYEDPNAQLLSADDIYTPTLLEMRWEFDNSEWVIVPVDAGP